MSFRLVDHTADVAVEATAETVGGVYAAVADGLAAAMCDEIPETGGERFDVRVRAESDEALLFDYLDQLIYERDVRGVLPVDNEATVEAVDDEGDSSDAESETEWRLDGSTRGVPLGDVTARDIKAVTYSEMTIEETTAGWRAYVVFDV